MPEALHCAVALSSTLYPLLSIGTTQDTPRFDRIIVDWDVKNQNKQTLFFKWVLSASPLE